MEPAKKVITTLSYGGEREYRRLILTILSSIAHLGDKHKEYRYVLFTDSPDYFKSWFRGLNIACHQLSQAKIKAMRGEIDFLHRVKIALIEETFNTYADSNILYLDSDTFFTQSPEAIFSKINEDSSFMHVREYEFSRLEAMPGDPCKAFFQLITTKDFQLANQTSIKVNDTDASWNAGVIALHRSHKRLLPDVFALTDQFYPETNNHACEQYAFSIILQKFTGLSGCESVVSHYWQNIKKQIIDLELAKPSFLDLERLSLEQKAEHVESLITRLPNIIENHFITLKDHALRELDASNFAKGYKWYFKAVTTSPQDSMQLTKDALRYGKHALRRATGKLGRTMRNTLLKPVSVNYNLHLFALFFLCELLPIERTNTFTKPYRVWTELESRSPLKTSLAPLAAKRAR
jgi:hypothetical protein